MAKILVVDDDADFVALMTRWLTAAGHQVVTASDGVEGLEQVSQQQPDLITLDIEMPNMDGYEVLGHLKANEQTRDIPIIIITSQGSDAQVWRGSQSGCDEYLLKSVVNCGMVLSFVRRHLRPATQQPEYPEGDDLY